MTATFLLARRYLMHYPVRTGILVLCIALVTFLPLAIEFLIRHYQKTLSRRARETPLVLGAKGSRFDLLLNSLYFKGRLTDSLTMADVEEIQIEGRAIAIPFLLRHTARDYPVVGTSLDYFEFRGLRVTEGTLPLQLGDAVLGAGVARALNLGTSSRLLSDSDKLYDLSSTYPLNMRVTGVLEEKHTPDDWAVFVDVKTAWIIEGIGHGHQDVDPTLDPNLVLEKRDSHVVTNAAIVEYTEITSDNIDSFHFHGGLEKLPVTAIIVVPNDRKSAVILGTRYRHDHSKNIQPLVPEDTLAELMGVVFRVKRFFDANLLLVSLATTLFLALIVLLSIRVRQREIETLFRLGCRRSTVLRIQAGELTLVLATGAVLGAGLAGLLYLWVAQGPLLL